MALQICLHSTMMCYQEYLRLVLIIFFNFNINCCVFLLKKVNYAIFFEVVLIIFSVSF